MNERIEIRELKRQIMKLEEKIARLENENEYLRNLSNTADQLKQLLKDMIFEERLQ